MKRIALVLAMLAMIAGCDMQTYRIKLYPQDGKVIGEWKAITVRSDDCLVYFRTSVEGQERAISGTVTVEPDSPVLTPEKP